MAEGDNNQTGKDGKKGKFTVAELEALGQVIERHRAVLYESLHATHAQSMECWEDITASVNAISLVERDVPGVKHRWQDLKLFFPFELIKFDIQKDEAVRNEQGWCERVKRGETGLLLSKVNSKNPFFGYAGNKMHTEKKLLCDVFRKGDTYFNTGDLMFQDCDNFMYFRDRIGDTFRWKGENVATTEVADIIGMVEAIQEANVYGVAVPGNEGKVGMASIVLKPQQSLNLKRIYEQVVTYLPGYAYPRFLRLQEIMEITGTFKQQKFRLVEEGFNPSKIRDPLYFLDDSQKSYVQLTQDIYDRILSGQVKL